MVYGYHVIWGGYGFWLPNDPRGSWSQFVGAWELFRFGGTTRHLNRTPMITAEERREREKYKAALKYPPVELTGRQAQSVARGFANYCREQHLTIWGCSILPEHIHLVIARFRMDIEDVVKQLKGAATKQLRRDGLDPMLPYKDKKGRIHTPWARGQWKTYLDSEQEIVDAIDYTGDNPEKEGKPRQHWSFVQPFLGLEEGGLITYLP